MEEINIKINEIKKFDEEISKYKVKCSCGCVTTITNDHKRKICRWCGKWVYLDPKKQFEEEIKRRIKGEGNNEERNRSIIA